MSEVDLVLKYFGVSCLAPLRSFLLSTSIGVGCVGVLFIFFIFPPSANGADQYACVVGGHGPYNDSLEGCRKIAQSQAQTNCALSSKTAEVKFSFSDLRPKPTPSKKSDKKIKAVLGTCLSVYLAEKQNCEVAICP